MCDWYDFGHWFHMVSVVKHPNTKLLPNVEGCGLIGDVKKNHWFMEENGEKHVTQFPRAEGDVFKLLILSKRHSQT